MCRLSVRLIVALFTFMIGVGAASAWFAFSHLSLVNTQHEVNIPPVPIEQKRKYKSCGAAGEAFAKDGHPASFSMLCRSDGMSFHRWSDYFDSPQRADKELLRRLKKSTEIIKREPLFDKNGRQVGEKVVATFPYNDPHNGPASILFTNGSTFAYAHGPSLQSVLEYETDLFQ